MNHSPKNLIKLLGRGNVGSDRLPPFILMTDEVRLPDPISVVPDLPRGCAVLLRHYATPTRYELARELAAVCRRHGVRLLIAGNARLARAVGADGLHLPEALLWRGPHRWRLWRDPRWIVTAAAHSRAALQAAARLGVDAALISPVFPTASHPDAPPLGVLKVAQWARASTVPVYALGGIGAANVCRLSGSGIAGIAGISGLAPKISGA